MFLQNKYTKWYYGIVNSTKNRDRCEILETHHIIPKSLGGTDDMSNLVDLTPREHYVCHRLLVKMTHGVDKHKMSFALHTFFHFNKYRKLDLTSRDYENHKKNFKIACKNRNPKTSTDIFKFRQLSTGIIFSGTRTEFKMFSGLNSQAVYWLTKSCMNPDDPKKIIGGWEIWIDELCIFSNEKYRPERHDFKHLQHIKCEFCDKTTSVGNYKRWHGNRCKNVDPGGHYERTRQVARINGDR